MTLLDTDLHMAICKGTLLKDDHKRYIFSQLQWVIKFHSGRVIHQNQRCPLPLTCPPTCPEGALTLLSQPVNILLDANCMVKLCDFDLAGL